MLLEGEYKRGRRNTNSLLTPWPWRTTLPVFLSSGPAACLSNFLNRYLWMWTLQALQAKVEGTPGTLVLCFTNILLYFKSIWSGRCPLSDLRMILWAKNGHFQIQRQCFFFPSLPPPLSESIKRGVCIFLSSDQVRSIQKKCERERGD